MKLVPPGSTIGILGGGQLGRMLAIAAAQLGYRSHIYAPEASGPATEVAAAWTQGRFEDVEHLRSFAAAIDIATYEFENIDPAALAYLAGRVEVQPPLKALDTARYRPHEKDLVTALGGRTAPYRPVSSVAELEAALAEIGTPAILKTTLFGYDGKGQAAINSLEDAANAWRTIGSPKRMKDAVPAIVERRVAFDAEFSVLLCRARDGQVAVWDTPDNVHKGGILDTSTVPARKIVLDQADEAIALTTRVAEHLEHVGLLTCEFFACTEGPVFNEMAPRVHNSGHWTIEGAVTSQFENHIRAVCGLPLGDIARTAAGIEMRNLVGDDIDQWPALMAEKGAHVHLYGKHESRAGRKMGHVTRLRR